MKFLIITIFLIPCFIKASTKCYIINESKIEHRTNESIGDINEICPIDLENINDLTYLEQNGVRVATLDLEKKTARLAQEQIDNDAELIRLTDLENNKQLLKTAYDVIDNINTIAELRQFLKKLTKHILRE